MYRCIVAFEFDFFVATKVANSAIINSFVRMNLFKVLRQAGIMTKLRAADTAFKRHFASMDEHVGRQIIFRLAFLLALGAWYFLSLSLSIVKPHVKLQISLDNEKFGADRARKRRVQFVAAHVNAMTVFVDSFMVALRAFVKLILPMHNLHVFLDEWLRFSGEFAKLAGESLDVAVNDHMLVERALIQALVRALIAFERFVAHMYGHVFPQTILPFQTSIAQRTRVRFVFTVNGLVSLQFAGPQRHKAALVAFVNSLRFLGLHLHELHGVQVEGTFFRQHLFLVFPFSLSVDVRWQFETFRNSVSSLRATIFGRRHIEDLLDPVVGRI